MTKNDTWTYRSTCVLLLCVSAITLVILIYLSLAVQNLSSNLLAPSNIPWIKKCNNDNKSQTETKENLRGKLVRTVCEAIVKRIWMRLRGLSVSTGHDLWHLDFGSALAIGGYSTSVSWLQADFRIGETLVHVSLMMAIWWHPSEVGMWLHFPAEGIKRETVCVWLPMRQGPPDHAKWDGEVLCFFANAHAD